MSKDLVQAQFSRSADKYVHSQVHAKGTSLDWLVSHLEPKLYWRMLDIATGAGHTAFAFAPHVSEVVASDLTPKMLETARGVADERGIANVAFEVADAEALPFEDRAFDAVTSRIAPHHFARVDLFLSEVVRVLKPGGMFGLVDNVAPDTASTPNFSSAELHVAAAEYNAFEKLRDPSHHEALQLGAWLDALNAAGFELQKHELLDKPMAFDPWAERLGASAADIATLRAMIDGGSPALRAFLRPEERGRARWITLIEAVIVATKPEKS